MRKSLRKTLLFFTLIAVGTVEAGPPLTPSPEPLSIVLSDGPIIVKEGRILPIQGFTPFFDSQKGSVLSEFLDYPVTPTFVEVTAYMNYENYADSENVNDTMILLRFLVEQSESVGMLYSLLMSAFSSNFLGGEEFTSRFWMKDEYQPLKLERLYHFLVSRKQSEIANAPQTTEGATGGASTEEEAVTAVGYALARHIRTVLSRFPRDEKVNAALAHFPEPAPTTAGLPPRQTVLLSRRQIQAVIDTARQLSETANDRASPTVSDDDETTSSSDSSDIEGCSEIMERSFERN
ncbi:hypothetical protein [Endozoicomonas sp. 4G]|uniref:hypothetical protein n=1 Tax=Endozoicomonas sp. 4G TaxID=2872754 RepID=UPI002079025F|nr:hypothetical protein [Endozoicomonas sp. 4G]